MLFKKDKKLNKILKARELRKELTRAEAVLWQHLRDRRLFNKKFRRQHVLRGFILDFYCPEEKLVIELDGSIHLTQKEYDKLRQACIEDIEIRFLRFNNNDILKKINKVLKTIEKSLSLSIYNGEGLLRQPPKLRSPGEDF